MHPTRCFYGKWALLALILAALCQPVLADLETTAWQVTELHGSAEWTTENDTSWQPLHKGDRIEPPTQVRTGTDGRVTLQRGGDSVKISPNSLLFFPAAERRDGNLFMRVLQTFGVVTYSVEKRPQPGFQVETHYLTSLVKGTLFEVAASDEQAAVTLLNGSLLVGNPDTNESVLIKPMQTASASRQHPRIRVITVHPGTRLQAPGQTSELVSSSSVDDASTFSWAQDVGLVAVTRIPSATDDSDPSLPADLDTHPTVLSSTVQQLDPVTGLQLPVIVDTNGINSALTTGSESLGLTGLVGDTAAAASGLLGDTTAQVGNVLGDTGAQLGNLLTESPASGGLVGGTISQVGNVLSEPAATVGGALGTTSTQLGNLLTSPPTSGGLLGGTLSQVDNLLSEPTTPGTIVPTPSVSKPLQGITGILGL